MLYGIVILVCSIILCLIILSIKHFVSKDSSTDSSTALITTGTSLIVSAFPGTKEIIISILASIFKEDIKVENDYAAIVCGFILIALGFYVRRDIKDRVFVLNMFGLFSQKEISDIHNIKALKLADFKVKEIIIDFVDLFNNGPITDKVNQLIVNKIKKQCEAFSNRSKDFKSCFTGMAPIPYTILAGTKLSGCNLKRFFEYKRAENKYYELKDKNWFQKYDMLQVKYPQNIDQDATDVVVALSITHDVKMSDLSQFGSLDVIEIKLDNTKDNVITSKVQLEDYGNVVLNSMEAIKDKYSKIKRIHLVASIPSCVSIKLGMLFALSNNRLPQIISYHFIQSNTPKYPFGVVVSEYDWGKLIIEEGAE